MEDLKQKLLLELDRPELSSLGDKKRLTIYLREEFKELDLSNGWNTIPQEPMQENKHNILVWYLMNLAPMPNKLEHQYADVDMPDIDVDFSPEGREPLKEHLREKYGKDSCMGVVTFGGTRVKSAIQDLARIDKIDPQEVFRVTTSIDYDVNDEEENRLENIVEKNKLVRDFLAKYPKIHDWTDKIQEVKRNVGTHASAFLVSNVKLEDYIPVVLDKEKNLVAAYPESSSVKALSSIGLPKQDLLGLESLTIIQECVSLVKKKHNIDIDWDTIDLNDKKVFKLLNQGLNLGIFQLESHVSSMVINTIKPANFDDLAAINAMIRPASLQAKAHLAYANHKKGFYDRDSYPVWKDLEGKVSDFTYRMLNKTWGICIYQEQIMALLAEFCGVTLDDTNKIRKIISIPVNKKSKENFEYIAEQRKKWMDFGSNKFGEKLAEQWWNTAVGSLTYGFNSSHCYAYSTMTYRQLWLKAYYPQEFYTALLKTTKNEDDGTGRSKLNKYLVEANKMNVGIEAPHILYSEQDLVIDDATKKTYLGFSQVKGIGFVGAKDIVLRRPYDSFEHFLEKHKKDAVDDAGKKYGRSGVNKTVIESLIYVNAFRDYGVREELLEKYWKTLLPKKSKDDPIVLPSSFDMLREEFRVLSIILSTTEPMKLPYGYQSISKLIDSEAGYRTEHARYWKIRGFIDKLSWQVSKKKNKYCKLLVNDFNDTVELFAWEVKRSQLEGIKEGDLVELEIEHKDRDMFVLNNVLNIKHLGDSEDEG